jgi:hypothetical protein
VLIISYSKKIHNSIFILKSLFLHTIGSKKNNKKFGHVMTVDIITCYTFGAHCRLGDHPPAIKYFVNSPFNIMLNLWVFFRLNAKCFWNYKTLEDRHYSLLNFKPFFLLVNTLPRFSQNCVEKWQVDACCSSKEFCANPRNVSTNRKTAIALFCLQNSFVYSKAFSAKLRTSEFEIKWMEEFKK